MSMKAPSFKTVVGTPDQLKLLCELTAEIHSITTNGEDTLCKWPAKADILYVKDGKRNGWDSIEELVEYTEDDHCFLSEKLPFVRFPAAVDMLKAYIKELKQPPFPFKTFDQVLMRKGSNNYWQPELFRSVDLYFNGLVGSNYAQLIPYKGNEALAETPDTPASGYWKIESGKPKLIRC